ncbi:MAG: hypothetical protein ABI760_11150 [Ferruginibacter sp.]
MPTKIVSERSNPQNGKINQQDLKRIIQDFENFVDIGSTISRTFTKINSISIPLEIIESLINPVIALPDDERVGATINLRFGITLPDQKDCNDADLDISNHLTVVLFLNRDGKTPSDQVGDFVITPGFKEFSAQGGEDGICCPLIHPAKAKTP